MISYIGGFANPIIGIFRLIFFFLDSGLYWLSGVFYSIALKMYDINSLMNTSEILSRFANLVYSFFAIFMFFKLAFSLLQMIVDPSRIEDKQNGAANIIKNVFICIALIAFVPKIFEVARDVQTKIIEDKIIEQAIYGIDADKLENTNVGHKLALTSWTIFLHPNSTNNKNAEAKEAWKKALNPDTADNATGAVTDSEDFFDSLFLHLNDKEVSGKYHLSYLWLFSTLFAIYLVWVFIKFAIDVSYRSFKLLVLQLISPVAIMSFLDPKSSKDGVFAKWTKECVKTYISLFIRILIYAIASILLFEFTKNMNSNTSFFNSGIYVKFTYLLALIAFIKNGPKMFDSMFGTELSKDSETKVATDLLRGAYGGIAGGVTAGAIAGVQAKKASMTGWNAIKKVGQNTLSGASKGFDATKKGNLFGVIKAGTGIVGDTKKSFGLEKVDKDHERELAQMSSNVTRGKARKNAAIARAKAEYKIDPTTGEHIPATDSRYKLDQYKNLEVFSPREKPEVMHEFAVGADGKKRNLNGFSFDFSNLSGDATAEGEYFKYISKVSEIEETGVSENGRKVYSNEAYKKMEKALTAMELTITNNNISEQMSSYNNAVDKKSAWDTLTDKINAEIRKTNPNAEHLSTELVKSQVCSKFGLDISTVSDSQLFKTSIEHFNIMSTGHTTDEWQNISGKASGDADAASNSTKTHETTAEGIRDSHRRKTFEEEKGIMESLASKAADRNSDIENGRL